MSKHLQNLQLMQQLKTPLAKTLAPRAFDIGADFEKDMEALGLNRNWSPEGRRNEAQKLIRSALRDMLDLEKPIEEYHSKTETMRAEAKRPAYDKADYVAALN